ncbi:hypothetical protein NQZ79_g4155 [Umbelopsis isabellina]|nr:hypothetical protein NQZ79_g4155 [Umbelopsis isabellina]
MAFDNVFWSSIAGYLSIGCWLIVFTPQLWENYTRKNGDGLSMTFLVIWLLGDVFNMIGVVMQDLLFTMLLLAVWYTLADIGLIWQVLHYESLRDRTKNSNDSNETDPLLLGRRNSISTKRKHDPLIPVVTLIISTVSLVGSIAYYSYNHLYLDDNSHSGREQRQMQLVPQIMGWTSAVLYVASRIPQIVKNYKGKSTDGLSLAMFFCAVMGNVFFTLSIFLRSIDPTYLLINLSWIIGSCGTLVFDFTIFVQFIVYRQSTDLSTNTLSDVEDD